MPVEVTMPRLSDTMEQGTVVKWNVKEGDSVKSGDVLADIETDKATMELESFDEGTVASLVAKEGESVSVGSVIAVIAGKGEDAAELRRGASAGASAKAEEKGEGAAKAASRAESGEGAQRERAASNNGAGSERRNGAAAPAKESGGGRIFASPLARKLAEERGVDLGEVKGTGPSGRIVKADVERAAGEGGGAPARVERSAPTVGGGGGLERKRIALSNMRRTIARRLVESKTTIPHYQVTVSVRMDRLLELREEINAQLEGEGVKISVNDFLVRACALAMHENPFVNSVWDERGGEAGIELLDRVNIGVAIALPVERGGGLVVATVRDADRMGVRAISQSVRGLAKKAREKGLTIEEQSDSTFTISNLGMFGVDHFTAIINPPNTAILAVGRSIERVFVEEGELVVGQEMSMTMSSDHRVIDGAMAATYLNSVKRMLEAPASLLV